MIFIALILLCLTLFLKKYESFHSNSYFVVCSKYNKNTDFLKELSIPSIVIDKNVVPNVANEATTYLYYILQNYDSLPENVIFIHDENESWHHDGKITENMEFWIKKYEESGSQYYEINKMTINKPDDYHNDAEKELWTQVFEPQLGNYNEVSPSTGKCCAQFIVSKNQIHKHPKDFYQKYYNWLIDNTAGEGNGDTNNIYSGYYTSRYAEWSWRFIFSP